MGRKILFRKTQNRTYTWNFEITGKKRRRETTSV